MHLLFLAWVQWENPFCQFTRSWSGNSTVEIFILRISTVVIGELFHGNLHFSIFHGLNQGIGPWKHSFWRFPRLIRESFHGNLHFSKIHGLNQGIVPWKSSFCQFPRIKSADRSMEIFILPFPMVLIRESFHGNLHFVIFHGLDQGIAPWKSSFCQFPRTKSEISTMEIFILPIPTA